MAELPLPQGIWQNPMTHFGCHAGDENGHIIGIQWEEHWEAAKHTTEHRTACYYCPYHHRYKNLSHPKCHLALEDNVCDGYASRKNVVKVI